jgi:hypothetical protein
MRTGFFETIRLRYLGVVLLGLMCGIILGLSARFALAAISIRDSVSTGGDVYVAGTISKGSGTFVIDHPLDPENKLLYHSFVESPDAKNIYDGVATLDQNGEAVIELPRYFMALNTDVRYLVSSIDGPQPDLHLKEEVAKRHLGLFGRPVFEVAGGEAGKRISWQVSGVRKDRYIVENPIVTEVEKDDTTLVDKGEYLFEGYGTSSTSTTP